MLPHLAPSPPSILHIVSDTVLRKIKEGEEGWEVMVPDAVATAIKKKFLFEYKPKEEEKEPRLPTMEMVEQAWNKLDQNRRDN
ncbi:MAG: hypothetical protein AAFU64_11700 [Bacteroidota bacterium]